MCDLARNWDMLVSLLPDHWQDLAKQSGAVARLRGFDSVEALLRCLLLHVGCGYSLRETATRAGLAGLAEVSDVTLLNRLRQSEGWLRQMCLSLLAERQLHLDHGLAGRRLRVVDGTLVREPGKTGTQWRVHYSLQLPGLACDHFAITAIRGSESHERLDRFVARPGELILADRGFCRASEIAAVRRQGADVLVRFGSISMMLWDRSGARFDWVREVSKIQRSGQCGQWPVWILDAATQQRVGGRLCAIRKSEEAIGRGLRRLKRRAQLKQHRTRATTQKADAYVMVFTTLPEAEASAEQVLECYRLRWQIELVFKRLKSLIALGHIPKHDPQSSHAWLYGKLLVALLSQKLTHLARTFSPWGYRFQ